MSLLKNQKVMVLGLMEDILFVIRGIFDLIKNDESVFEDYPLSELAKNNNLAAWKHNGFWKAMDTIRDKQFLNDLWNNGKRPWVNK